MQHISDLNQLNLKDCWLTIGSYDGVHLGHQQIIEPLVQGAHQSGLPAVVVTFHPHPMLVIQEQNRPFYLTLPEKRARILGELGVDYVLTYPFTNDTSLMSAKDFVSALHDRSRFSCLWIGHDFALGRDREGDSDRLRELGDKFGYSLHQSSPYFFKEELISSSLIRNKIRDGLIEEANQLLGRTFEISGIVIAGENRGKSLGFATSNLDVPLEVVDIKPGVYACWAEVQGERWKAVTNIGFRPTFDDGLTSPRIETHLLGFSGDLYGEELHLQFVDRLRDEMKFDQVSDLQVQVKMDITEAERILGD
jgi:riboflavin kinase/FMN adenylyltransferase